MLLSLVLAAALPSEARFNQCIALIRVDGPRAIVDAEAWRDSGGGALARQCLGLAYVAAERWAPAAIAFEQAAREAEIHGDGRAATLWVQSGNARLAGNDPAMARIAFDRGLAMEGLSPAMRGEALIDRARAAVEFDNLASARSDLDAALKLVPGDPMGWLLSAALARRQGQLERAGADIAEAQRLAPGDEAILAEQDRIAGMRAAAGAGIKAP